MVNRDAKRVVLSFLSLAKIKQTYTFFKYVSPTDGYLFMRVTSEH